jgi:hypothetical protein
MATVPVVGLALGSVAGLGAARVATSHYSLMVEGISQIFAAGPPVVARAGEKVTKDELGGTAIHGTNGTVDDVVASEAEAFLRTRRFLSYLPPSVHALPPRGAVGDDPLRSDEWLLGAIPRDPRKVYKMRPIVEALVDRGSFFEIGRAWGKSVITGFARLDGWPVAVLGHRNRTPVEDLVARGAREAADLADLATGADVIILCVTGTPEVEDLIHRPRGILATCRAGQIVIDDSEELVQLRRDLDHWREQDHEASIVLARVDLPGECLDDLGGPQEPMQALEDHERRPGPVGDLRQCPDD